MSQLDRNHKTNLHLIRAFSERNLKYVTTYGFINDTINTDLGHNLSQYTLFLFQKANKSSQSVGLAKAQLRCNVTRSDFRS